MYCDKCGRKISEDARFCSFCGTPVEESKESKKSSSSKPMDGMGYGYKKVSISQKDRFDEEWEKEERKEKITFMIFGVVIVVLVIAIVCGLIALLKDESEKFMNDDSFFSGELNENLLQNKDDDKEVGNHENSANNSTNKPNISVTPELISPGEDDDTENSNNDGQEQDAPEENDDVDHSEYIIYDSNERYLTAADLNGLSAWEIRVARNELYARYGRMFDSKELQEHFLSKSWYTPMVPAAEFNNALLNAIERENLNFIVSYEKAHDLN